MSAVPPRALGWRGRPGAIAAGIVGLALFVWLVPLQLGWYGGVGLGDVGLYRGAAEQIAGGAVPYRDFALEYPPAAAGLFAAAWPWPIPYPIAFSALMLLALAITAVATYGTGRALGLGERRAALAGVGVAVSPLLLGGFVERRYDLALAAAIAVMLYGAATRRFTVAWGALAFGVLLKLAPLALLPALVIYHAHVHGLRRAMTGAACALAAVLAVFAPFLIASPSGTLELLRYHLDRPLQIESTGAAVLHAFDQAGALALETTTSFGSQNLVGGAPATASAASSLIAVALVSAIAVVLSLRVRGSSSPADARLFVAAVLATLVAVLVAGKVLSPQFLLWLLPAAFLLPGRQGRVTAVIAGVAFLLTQAYYPALYWNLVDLSPGPVVLLVLRDVTLVALLVAAWPRSGQQTSFVTAPPAAPERGGRLVPVAATGAASEP